MRSTCLHGSIPEQVGLDEPDGPGRRVDVSPARGSVGCVSTDEEWGDTVGDTVSEATNAALREIEDQPLDERAPGYQALADRLRVELEHSDPSRAAD
jgi:hypothetical protein